MSSKLANLIEEDEANPPRTLHQITVLTPYFAQTHLYFNSFCSNHRLQDVRIHTVDRFQGCKSPVVFLTSLQCHASSS
jgi:superfamily I DNA and/or RNA helicase